MAQNVSYEEIDSFQVQNLGKSKENRPMCMSKSDHEIDRNSFVFGFSMPKNLGVSSFSKFSTIFEDLEFFDLRAEKLKNREKMRFF